MAAKQEPREKEGKKEGEGVIQVSSLVSEHTIVEQVWEDSKPALQIHYLGHKEGNKRDEIVEEIITKDLQGKPLRYVPVDNEHLRKGSVIIPLANTGYENASFSQLWTLQDKLLDIAFDAVKQREEAQLLMRMCTASWFIDKEETGIASMGKFAPILAIRGPSGGGKGRLGNILRFCSYHPFHQSSTNKIPSIYRPLEIWKGALSLNECDLDPKKDKDLVAFLVARSYGDPISRQNPNNISESNAFNHFQLTIAIQRENFGENALEGRTVPFYCEKSWEKLPTLETPEMIELGQEIQRVSLGLRMKFYSQIQIDKKYWLDTSDARLNSALLPLVAISVFDSSIKTLLNTLLRRIERRKTLLKAQSDDGILINYLYEKVGAKDSEGNREENLFRPYRDGHAFYFLHSIVERETEDSKVGRDAPAREEIPLTTSKIGFDLSWNSPGAIRKKLDALLHVEDLPGAIRINGGKTVKPIFFRPPQLLKQFREFVLDFDASRVPEELRPEELKDKPGMKDRDDREA